MRILVCFKVTPDYEALSDADWVAGESEGVAGAAGTVECRYVPRILDCFDESALEMALRMSDPAAGRGIASGLRALSIGGREVDPYLKILLALGYERATRVESVVGLDFAPTVAASIIAGYVREMGESDLLMLGCRSGPGGSEAAPFLVAEALGWPCLTQVTEVSALGDDRVRVACVVDEGLLRATVRLPCVLGVGNAAVSRLRVPTLTDRLVRRDAHIDLIQAADLGIDVVAELGRETCVLAGFEVIRRERQSQIVLGETPRQKARVLFDSHLKSVIGQL